MKVVVYKDDENEIVVSKDHYHGIVVQAVRYIDALQQTADGQLLNIVKAQVMHTEKINVLTDMRTGVQEAISKCQSVVNDLKEKDKKILGVLSDLRNAYRVLNEPTEQ